MGEGCLNELITDVECLNLAPNHDAKNLFQRNEGIVRSDCDHQLLIKVQFRQPVKISGIKFTGVKEETAPSDVKLFVNKMHIGFSDAEDTPETQALCLDKEQNNLTDKDFLVPVKFVKFQNVSDLVIFVNDNIGNEDVSEIKNIEIFGLSAEDSNIKNWKPVKG